MPQIPGAAPGWPSWRQIAWIVVAMVGARSAAMTMNRIIDLRYDRENPRTRTRALATGALTVGFAWVFAAAAAAVLAIAAWQLNPLALELSPVALAVLVFLFLHQAIHVVVAPGAGILPGDVSGGGLDRHRGIARRAHVDSVRGRDALGGRLRRALRVPGHRVRQDRWSFFPCRSGSAWRARCRLRARCTW